MDYINNPGEGIRGILKKVRCIATCDEVNKGIKTVVDYQTRMWGAKKVELFLKIVTDLQDPYDPVLQAQHLDQAVAQKPDLIALLATNARSVVPGLRRAQAMITAPAISTGTDKSSPIVTPNPPM